MSCLFVTDRTTYAADCGIGISIMSSLIPAVVIGTVLVLLVVIIIICSVQRCRRSVNIVNGCISIKTSAPMSVTMRPNDCAVGLSVAGFL